jgi:hypothetical protein
MHQNQAVVISTRSQSLVTVDRVVFGRDWDRLAVVRVLLVRADHLCLYLHDEREHV